MGEAFRQIIPTKQGRVLISSFASNIHRMQQAIDVAVECGRSVAVIGRSMRKNLNIARNLGYIDAPEDMLVRPVDLDELPPDRQLILCTGSQGEPLSALTRIAYNDHPAVQIERGDTVIISARAVPGNELRVHDSINRLTRSGAEVLHEENAAVHVSGHARAEELRTLIGLLRPKAVMPIHGEFRMMAAHARLAQEAGVPASSIVIADNGDVIELSRDGVRVVDQVEAGMTFVDGLGVGDLSDVALRDRRHLSEDGVLIVVATLSDGLASAPELISRGFAESDELMSEMRGEAQEILRGLLDEDIREIKLIQEHLHDGIGQLVYDRTRRRPMILPVVVETSERRLDGAQMRSGWAEALTANAAVPRTAKRLISASGDARGRGARVLPPARGLGAWETRCRRLPPRVLRRCRRRRSGSEDALGELREPARALPARAAARAGRGRHVVRRAGRRRARRLGARARPGGRRRRSEPRDRGLPRARRARAGARGPVGGRRVRGGAGSRLALGRPLRPAREPARPRAGRPPRARCIILRGMAVELTVVGSINVDFVARMERLPRPGETVPARQFERFPGGKGANQAVAAARMGATVRMIGAVGDDALADEALAGLVEAGVELDVERTGQTGVALIYVDLQGENEIAVFAGRERRRERRARSRAQCWRSSRCPTRSSTRRPRRPSSSR